MAGSTHFLLFRRRRLVAYMAVACDMLVIVCLRRPCETTTMLLELKFSAGPRRFYRYRLIICLLLTCEFLVTPSFSCHLVNHLI